MSDKTESLEQLKAQLDHAYRSIDSLLESNHKLKAEVVKLSSELRQYRNSLALKP